MLPKLYPEKKKHNCATTCTIKTQVFAVVYTPPHLSGESMMPPRSFRLFRKEGPGTGVFLVVARLLGFTATGKTLAHGFLRRFFGQFFVVFFFETGEMHS